METYHKYKQTCVYCGMIKRWIARNLMLGRETGQAFPLGEHIQAPSSNSGTDSFYFYLRNQDGLTMVCRLALRFNGFCEYWFGLSMPDQPTLVLEGTAPVASMNSPNIKGLAFIPDDSGVWSIAVDFPEFALKGCLCFSPTSLVLDFGNLRDKNQIAGALASMPWNAASFKALKSMKTEHIEQAGVWSGELTWNGVDYSIEGVGARDHSRGERNWQNWSSHCWFTGFNEHGKGFNLSLIDFKGLPTLRAGYICDSKLGAVCLVDGPNFPISHASGEFVLAGHGDQHTQTIHYSTQGFFEFTMDSTYRIVEGFGFFDWKGERFFGILERGFALNHKHVF